MSIALGPVRPGLVVLGGQMGVLASTLATSGEAGPAYPGAALDLPTDNGLEISAWITRWPTNGTLTLLGDTGQFTYSGGVDYFLWELRVMNQVVPTDIGFGPGISRVDLLTVGGDVSGTLDLAAVAPAGTLGGGGASGLGGGVTLGGVDAAGQMVSTGPSALGGDAALGPVVGQGAIQGDLSNWVPEMGPGLRSFRPGRITPKWLATLDVEEADNLTCDFSAAVSTLDPIVDAAWTCEARVGNDFNARPLLFGAWQQQGALVRQRIKGELGVPGVTYLIRVEGTTQSGRVIPAAAFIKVWRAA